MCWPAERGLPRIEDADRATIHFLVLVSVAEPSRPRLVLTDKERDEIATAGVRTFLHGYLG
ncbi:hypothetical protein ACFYWY_30660 [Streptomyces sp. NPDC002870]|uniref:hypothetical protein n=1 Tax=Streptomyces sp. NPDC002870 TaxID=3364666 RepID=UPI0036803F0E